MLTIIGGLLRSVLSGICLFARGDCRTELVGTSAALALTLLVGLADFLTGQEISFAIFYVLPVTVGAWWGRRRMALLVAGVAAVAWYAADQWVGHTYSHPAIGYWNGFSRFLLFSIITLLVQMVRTRMEREREQANTDSLTGLLNVRAFHSAAERELERARRFAHPFALAFVDLDNFKQLNDSRGHDVGDRALKQVAAVMTRSLRKSDIAARLGGDEFGVLLTETKPEQALVAVEELRDRLLAAMSASNYPITFSIGLIGFVSPPQDVGTMLHEADQLMYEVKRSGKNAIRNEIVGSMG